VSSPTVPLDQYVLKVHSRCDLACDHCYVYESADQSWRQQPTVMSGEVIAQTAQRIAEHARVHELGTVQVVLHGGEPLLAGAPRLRDVITGLHEALTDVCQLDLRIHTNGVRLNEQFCDLFAEYGVKVGVSIDGDRAANDRHRRYANGRSSYDPVLRAIQLLRTDSYRHLYAGLLCTVDIANDPVKVYESLASLAPPRIDFLLPHATWDSAPVRTPAGAAEYADWLIAIFDRWLATGRPMGIRTFESIVSTLSGGASLTEALGLAPASLVVIETDGSYEQVDSLKTAFDGAPATGLNVFTDPVDAAGQHPGIVARQQGLAALSQTCRSCPVVSSCGGGLYAHRYRAESGFDNPSVYCADLFKLITHVEGRVRQLNNERRLVSSDIASGEDFRELAKSHFDELAAGHGNSTAIAQLAEGQRSRQRAVVAEVYALGRDSAVVSARVREAFHGSWAVLASAHRARPEALELVLAHPYVRVWAVGCVKELKAAAAARSGPSLEFDRRLSHLSAIATAAAIRAGEKADLAVPVIDGAVHLPTLGRLIVRDRDASEREARLTVGSSVVGAVIGDDCWEISVETLLSGESAHVASLGAGDHAEWQPVRMLNAPGLSVALEDTDPYRDCHQHPAAPRLTDVEAACWQEQFVAAWQEISRDHPDYASGIAAGLSVLMPMAPAPLGREVSSTARHGFGAVGAALPADATTLALLIMHEFQHVKLGAVLDVYDLYDPADDRLYYAPWREDMRPLEGLLQGTYAHLAVSDYWRVRQETTTGSESRLARERYEFWHGHTQSAIETLADSGSMTPLGANFVAAMRRSAASP
jgi:uncharacterized protein